MQLFSVNTALGSPDIPHFKFHVHFRFVDHSKDCQTLMPCVIFDNALDFSDKELLVPHPTFKLEDGSSASVCQCLLNIFAATIRIWMPFTTGDVPFCGNSGLTEHDN
jgi:hypothetical protein